MGGGVSLCKKKNYNISRCFDNNILADFSKYFVNIPTEQERVVFWENEVPKKLEKKKK